MGRQRTGRPPYWRGAHGGVPACGQRRRSMARDRLARDPPSTAEPACWSLQALGQSRIPPAKSKLTVASQRTAIVQRQCHHWADRCEPVGDCARLDHQATCAPATTLRGRVVPVAGEEDGGHNASPGTDDADARHGGDHWGADQCGRDGRARRCRGERAARASTFTNDADSPGRASVARLTNSSGSSSDRAPKPKDKTSDLVGNKTLVILETNTGGYWSLSSRAADSINDLGFRCYIASVRICAGHEECCVAQNPLCAIS